ncbi:MAG: hypothetical protein GXY43_09275 [Clostridiaceae bacterium]|nr:hypothetical protein [Clostridiaceae bacterium]
MRRETTSYERVMFYYSKLGPMFFAFRMGLEGPLTEARLRAALQKNRIEFPLSAVRIEKLSDRTQWITTENVPEYPLLVKPSFSGDPEEELILLLREPFQNEEGPMVRFALLQNEKENQFIAVFQHAVVDGVGAVIFLERLMEHLGNPDLPAIAPGENDWAPMLHKMISQENMEKILAMDPPKFKDNKDYTRYTPKDIQPEAFPVPPFRIHLHGFSKSETEALIAAAATCKTTVHSFIGAMILQCFAEEFGPSEGYLRTIQSPINFRSQLREGSERTFGLFNGLITAQADCPPGRPTEEIAREIGAKLHEKIESLNPLAGYYNFMTYLLEGVRDPEEFYANREAHTPDPYDFSFSNLGRVKMADRYGDLCVKEFFGPTFSATRGERVIGALTCCGKLFMNMIYDQNCFDPDTGDRIWNRIIEKCSSVDPVK